MHVAQIACAADLWTFEELTGVAEGERERLFERMTPAPDRLLRRWIAKEQLRTQMPKPAKPHFPEVRIADGTANRPTLCSFGSSFIPPEEAANSFSELTYEVAAIEPCILPYPAPNLSAGPLRRCEAVG